MKKHLLTVSLLVFLVGFVPTIAMGDPIVSVTLATFADPSPSSSNYLFKVDFTQMEITGGWSDAQTGLVLEIPVTGYTVENSSAFQDAWFEMSTVQITSAYSLYGETGAGVINFYENGTAVNPLVTINFESGLISRFGLGAEEVFVADNVTITGSKIPNQIEEERFAFSFANLAKLSGHTLWTDGFTATAAFTSSAVPEPATIALLSIGALSIIRRKKTV
ncbi:MAG: PEP-CTERM sorting domain-containing protein [Sedimentisphaerales bacterium]